MVKSQFCITSVGQFWYLQTGFGYSSISEDFHGVSLQGAWCPAAFKGCPALLLFWLPSRATSRLSTQGSDLVFSAARLQAYPQHLSARVGGSSPSDSHCHRPTLRIKALLRTIPWETKNNHRLLVFALKSLKNNKYCFLFYFIVLSGGFPF